MFDAEMLAMLARMEAKFGLPEPPTDPTYRHHICGCKMNRTANEYGENGWHWRPDEDYPNSKASDHAIRRCPKWQAVDAVSKRIEACDNKTSKLHQRISDLEVEAAASTGSFAAQKETKARALVMAIEQIKTERAQLEREHSGLIARQLDWEQKAELEIENATTESMPL